MSALAVYFEEEGIATSVIGLVRLHLEKVQPPRALWVPFELGRPLGQPNNPGFQKQVLHAALRLLEAKTQAGSVILENFPEDEPGIAGDQGWSAPELNANSPVDEVSQLEVLYARAKVKFGRTTVGLSGLEMTTIVQYLSRFLGGRPMQIPYTDISEPVLLRFAVDDLKAFYMEAACADTSQPSSRQLTDWFWNETLAAGMIRDLRQQCLASSAKKYRLIGDMLVPRVRL